MKKHLIGVVCLLICSTLVTTNLTAQNFENPGEYMTYISKQHGTIAKRFLAYNSAVSHGKKAKKVENLRAKLLDEIQESRMNISGMPAFKGDKEYRDSAVSFMKLYFNVLNEDYGKIVNMQEIAEQSYDAMEAYLLAKDLVDKKMDEASQNLHLVSKKFAAAHNVNLIDGTNEIDDMMKQVGETGDYYNPIYLIFFKSYKQEAYMMAALETKNINGIEQNRNTLLQYSQDGLKRLDTMKAFKSDKSLVTTCKKMLEFYVKEADKITVASDFLLKQEAFEKMKKEYEKKGSPTKEDVDAYNKAIKELNTAVNAYNNNNTTLNNQRSDFLNGWNSAVDTFFDNHMPVYNK